MAHEKITCRNTSYSIMLYCIHSLVHSKCDEYGFERPDDFNYDEYEKFMAIYFTVLTKRAMRWSRLMTNNPQLKKNGRLREYIRKGIPITLRAQVDSIHINFNNISKYLTFLVCCLGMDGC